MEAFMRKVTSLLLGALVGGLVGSSLALLFAPSSGEETRQQINDYFTNLKQEVESAAEEKRAELEAQLKKLRSGQQVAIEEKEV
jgi:gas vesicle protein